MPEIIDLLENLIKKLDRPPIIIGHSAGGVVVSADGTRIGYRRMGQGPSVILLHGGVNASQHMLRLGRALADAFMVYLPDRRGPKPKSPRCDSPLSAPDARPNASPGASQCGASPT